MIQTENINLPILQEGDKYSKDIQNQAFRDIDREIKGLNDRVKILDNVEGSIIETKEDVEALKINKADTITTNNKFEQTNQQINKINEQLDKIATKNNWFINISELLPIGVTDISDYLIQAIEMLPSQGGTIILPCEKEYTLSKTITINKNNVVLKGNSQYFNTVINITANIGLNVKAYGFECEKLRFVGNGTQEGGLDATNTAIVVGDGIYSNYDNFLFSNSQCFKFGTAIIVQTRNFDIVNSTFTWCLNGIDIKGLTYENVTQSDRRNYNITDNRFHVCWGTALKLSGNVSHSEVKIVDNQFDRCGDNIVGYCEDSLIANNIITIARGYGIKIDNTNISCGDLGLTITNNTVSKWMDESINTTQGIYLKVNNSKIQCNHVSRCGGHGIDIAGNNNSINDNYSKDNDYYSKNLYHGIKVKGNYNQLDGNYCVKIRSNSTQQYGIFIDSTSVGTKLGFNICIGNIVGEINSNNVVCQGLIGEGLSRALRFGSGMPNNSEGQRGDFVINKLPEELGSAGSKYIIHGWQKIQDYLGGITWVEVRTLTGR